METSYRVCFLIFAFVCIAKVKSLEHFDLETMGIHCPNMVSCESIGSSNFTRRNCECDRECIFYKDCCIDAGTRVASRNRRTFPFLCMPFSDELNMGAYVIHTCSRNFAGPAEMQRKCQNQNNFSDPLMAAPVTDTSFRTTYRNRYCAECNNANISSLQTWLIRMDCDFTSTISVTNDFIWENIHYRPNLNKWGVEIDDRFHTCELMFDKPDYLTNSVRLCRANVVSTCPRDWSRLNVKRDCEAYTAIMYTNTGEVYKNPHCALCNGRTVDNISCDRGISSRKKKPFSFALLLDVNQSDGDIVGVSRPRGEVCGPNQKYDPYFKKCRNLVCALPGYKMLDGKCTKPG